MKKTRLLEIVREEIASALNEFYPNEYQDQQGFDSHEQLKEEQLDEMAYNIVLSNPEELAKLKDKIKDSTKKGEQLLSQVIDIIQRDKKEDKPIRQRDIANELGTIQQKINPLVNILIDYGILSKGESVTGVTKKTPSDKPKKEKPESTGKRGRPAGTKTATRTPGDDGFDDVSYSDEEVEDTYYKDEDEDILDTEKAPAGDVEMEKAARGKDELVKQYKSEVEPELKNKIAKAKEGDKEAMAWLKSKQDIIKKYNQAKQVNI
jgi:hypothetical protein